MTRFATRAPGVDRCGAGRRGGPRGQLARRRRRGPQGLRAADGAQARNVSPEGPRGYRPKLRRARVTAIACAALATSGARRPGALRAPLKTLEKVLTNSVPASVPARYRHGARHKIAAQYLRRWRAV
jgi:hypothetical protein